MQITNLIKGKNEEYLVVFNNETKYSFYEDTIIKYYLFKGKLINESLLKEIINYNIKIKMLNKYKKILINKKYSIKEITNKLSNENISDSDIEYIICYLKDINLLNDITYTKSFMHDKFILTNKGPKYIVNELINKGIQRDIIESSIKEISKEDMDKKIINILSKRINNKYSNKMFYIKNRKYLLGIGFDINDINRVLKIGNKDTSNILNKEYNKLSLKYNDKYIIKNKLLSKGYELEDINNLFQ